MAFVTVPRLPLAMAKVSSVYLAATVNELAFYTHRVLDERAREAIRAGFPPVPAVDVPRAAIERQWADFVAYVTPSGWVH